MKNCFAIVGTFLLMMSFQTLLAQELNVYRLNWRELHNKKQVAFISLSESYSLSEHPDSLAVPSVATMKIDDAEYLTLTGAYRTRFLAGTHLTDADRVFVYDYSIDSLLTFLVKDINVVACFEGYGGEKDFPYSQYHYQIGFNIPTMFLKGFSKYYQHVFACVGRVNPFVQGQMKPIAWRKSQAAIALGPDGSITDPETKIIYALDQKYEFKFGGLHYILQDLLTHKELNGRRLQVYNEASKALVCERIFRDGEGTSCAPLNFMNPEGGNEINQWTGKLFKNKPSAVFGFLYISFGCESITFLGPRETDLIVRCDNRH